jgi:NAD(P)H-hydrate epimerase
MLNRRGGARPLLEFAKMTDNESMNSTIPLYTAQQVRTLDRAAIDEAGIQGHVLMARAGQAVWDFLHRHWPDARSIVVACGTGNNGGDGYVVARLAQESGCPSRVIQLGDAGRLTGDALRARNDWLAAGGEEHGYDKKSLTRADVIVDALLGTGLERPLEGEWRDLVEAINQAPTPVLAIDIPSGLHADSGAVLGACVRACHTVTFIGRKQGLYTGDGPQYAGTVTFTDLHVPASVYQQATPAARLLTEPPLGRLARPRTRTAHKGDHGHLLVIGGEAGMTGAVQLAGMAALRVGTGLVSIATRPEHAAMIAAVSPELMSHGVAGARELAALLKRADIVIVGPGLGQSRWARELFAAVLDTDLPLVVDADALNLLAREPESRDNWVLTPHPGEAGRLLKQSTRDVQADRFAAASALAGDYGGTVVLKGAGSLVCSAGEPVTVCALGNPGMATAGMGDVLSGVIAGLAAQGLGLRQATLAGVCVHGIAGDRAALAGERGMTARDVINELRAVMEAEGESR